MRVVKLDIKSKGGNSKVKKLVATLKRQRSLIVMSNPPVFIILREHALHLESLLINCGNAVRITVIDVDADHTGDAERDVQLAREAFNARKARVANENIPQNVAADDLDSWMLIWHNQ